MRGTMLIDRDHLGRQTFGDTELARELLDLFAQQCRRLVPGITDPSRPADERADLAHTLKGSALGIGAVDVAALATTIEDALRQHRGLGTSVLDLDAVVTATLCEISGAA
ncbi:Hpt domain-containing protein [Methylobacterium sp. BTF04]|uniref:Hpt domain-containing protein n=1 Tax=Methylobacterium sp. BTF04 TaxID=2708300 RepID=UPI0013D896C1|nr:Hpt domain-containing protein [Methylobacterium sp. BTF04]NEU11773.1 Hpt domain-containing protein [Methylobacterium sp. BTF04]